MMTIGKARNINFDNINNKRKRSIKKEKPSIERFFIGLFPLDYFFGILVQPVHFYGLYVIKILQKIRLQ